MNAGQSLLCVIHKRFLVKTPIKWHIWHPTKRLQCFVTKLCNSFMNFFIKNQITHEEHQKAPSIRCLRLTIYSYDIFVVCKLTMFAILSHVSIIIINRKICEWNSLNENSEHRKKRIRVSETKRQTSKMIEFVLMRLFTFESNSLEECAHFRCCYFAQHCYVAASCSHHTDHISLLCWKCMICFYLAFAQPKYIQFENHQSASFCRLWLRLIWIIPLAGARFIYLQRYIKLNVLLTKRTVPTTTEHNQF